MSRRSLRRDEWSRIVNKSIAFDEIEFMGMKGKASILKMNEITEAFYVENIPGEKTKIVEVGYAWVQLAFEDQFFWITSMFDEKGQLFQIYVDMTDGNVLEADDPYFDDMYLDYVVDRDSDEVIELDADELEEAYREGEISELQYQRTLEKGRETKQFLVNNLNPLRTFLKEEYTRLMKELSHSGKAESKVLYYKR